MRDASRDDGAEHLAPVSYLPWAAPGVERDTDLGDTDLRDTDLRDTDLGGARRPGAVSPLARDRPVARIDSRAGGASAHLEPGEPGAERDARIDALVVSRLRRSSLSIAEVRSVLTEHGLDEVEVDEWIERYERLGYLNDVRLAEQLVRTGAERRGRGSGAILAELARRGIGAEATRAALDELDPDVERRNALAVAERRARQLRGLDPAVAERRLTAFLQRRGYDLGVVREAVSAALAPDRP
jgi:regulatory protein